MKKVYICSPYRGDVETNVQNARKYCRAAVELGCLPIAPHLFFPQFMDDDDPAERRAAIKMGIDLIGVCAEIWVFGLDHPTEGMSMEIQHATSRNIPVLDGFEMIGESGKKSTIADASENELNEQNPKYPCIKSGRLYLSCVCDGTLYFQGELRRYIQAFGCTDIQGRTEIVKDADPPWMNCRFVAHGKVPDDWPKEADRVWFDQKKGLIHILPKETMED